MNKKAVQIIGGWIVFIVICVIYFFYSYGSSGDVKEYDLSAVTQDSDVTYDLVRSESNGTTHKLYIIVKNEGNGPASISSDIYYIKSDGKKFKSSDKVTNQSDLNPGMSTNVTVTFEMDRKYLDNKKATLYIDNGLFFENSVGIKLNE